MNPKTRRHLEIVREILVAIVIVISVAAVVLLSQARPAQHDEAQVTMLDELERLVGDAETMPQSRAPGRDTIVTGIRTTVRR